MAISEEVRANILRYHHVEKWRVGTIASQLGVHHSTVKRVLSETGVAKNKILVEQSMIDPFLSFILEQLKRYLVSNDMHCSAERLYEVYQKRWRIEEFHKSIKQNASLEKSPTKKVKTQCNHVYAAMIAYCKLEMLKFKTGLNHFSIKYKLIVRANQIAMQELKNMAC